ncbi:MAG TPA: hypothetical protein VK512_03245 [Xanthobacteraceae bacterium]|nr:hypothetical protein [Xanthobacteraceae bacterium]
MYTWEELIRLYRLTVPNIPSNLQPRYNICLTTTIDAVVENEGKRALEAATRKMNPSVPQSVIDEAYERDAANAAAEYGALFRSDIESFIAREAVEACIATGFRERPRMAGIKYSAFVDPSGGSADSMTLAIAHVEKDVAILDAVRERKPPFSPEDVVSEFALLLKSCRINKVSRIEQRPRRSGAAKRRQFYEMA